MYRGKGGTVMVARGCMDLSGSSRPGTSGPSSRSAGGLGISSAGAGSLSRGSGAATSPAGDEAINSLGEGMGASTSPGGPGSDGLNAGLALPANAARGSSGGSSYPSQIWVSTSSSSQVKAGTGLAASWPTLERKSSMVSSAPTCAGEPFPPPTPGRAGGGGKGGGKVAARSACWTPWAGVRLGTGGGSVAEGGSGTGVEGGAALADGVLPMPSGGTSLRNSSILRLSSASSLAYVSFIQAARSLRE